MSDNEKSYYILLAVVLLGFMCLMVGLVAVIDVGRCN